jgi:hypothetical protein
MYGFDQFLNHQQVGGDIHQFYVINKEFNRCIQA